VVAEESKEFFNPASKHWTLVVGRATTEEKQKREQKTEERRQQTIHLARSCD